MLKYPGLFEWSKIRIHLCMLCGRDIVSKPLCHGCEEKMEREAMDYLGKNIPDYGILELREMSQVVLDEAGNN